MNAPDADLGQFRIERTVALYTAVAVVALVMYLVLRNKEFVDPNLVVILRIIISLAIGILGATIPGFMRLRYDGGGFSIRAGGALALFVLTFFGTPHVQSLKLAPPSVQLDTIKQVDVRSSLGPEATQEQRLNAQAYLTVPILLRSVRQPSARATLDATEVSFTDDSGRIHQFKWRNFVRMHEERHGVWLGIDEAAHSVAIESGGVVYQEILHEPSGQLHWRDALLLLEGRADGMLKLTIAARVGEQILQQVCNVDLGYWAAQIRQFRQARQESPGRVTMNCVG
jgi:hypothetical protein